MASPSSAPVVEADRRRERATLALSARDDHAAVIRLCESWAQVGRPTTAARVAQGRAFLALCLVDRAVARAREVVEGAPSDRAALRLLAEAYIERGWPMRARPVLESLRASGESVDALMARTSEEPMRPEAVAREIEAGNEPAKLLSLAERFMCTGSSLRARGLLERLRAAGMNPRVDALLWALNGDFSTPEPLELVVKRALPLLVDLGELPEESEHTESLSPDGQVLLEPESGDVTFPTLFKATNTAGAPVPAFGPILLANDNPDDERTASSDVAPPVSIANVSGAAEGDTQILRVLGEAGDGPMHSRKEGAATVHNLRQWQASMGVDPLGSDLDGTDFEGTDSRQGDLLNEDSSIARKPRFGEAPLVEAADLPPPPPEPTRTYSAPIEVVERYPAPANDPPTLDPRAYGEVESRASALGRPILGLLVVAFVGLSLLIFVGLLARASGLLDAARASVDLGHTLAASDYSALLEAESRLEASARTPSERAELARARVVLWSEYNGDHALLAQVDELLAAPQGVDAHRLAYLRAAELLAFRNPASALAALGRKAPQDDEERLVLARAKSALGDVDGAMAELDQLTSPESPRYRLARASMLRDAGRLQEARALVALQVASAPNHIASRLLELQLRTGAAGERAAAADVFRKTYGTLGLSPRQFGEAAWVEASAWNEVGETERAQKAAETGLARDGTHRELLLFLATHDLLNSEIVASARKLRTVHDLYRADPELRRNLVLVLCDLDRIDEAREVAKGANPPHQTVLEAYVAGWSPSEGAPDAANVPTDTALGAWAKALLATAAHRPDAALLADSAAKALALETNPYVHRLAPRAEALTASLLEPARATAQVASLRRSGIGDAGAHVYIAQYYEREGNRSLAAQHFDRATELEPELAWALYERGRFYADASDEKVRMTESWAAYMDLAPTGPRAIRVKTSPLSGL